MLGANALGWIYLAEAGLIGVAPTPPAPTPAPPPPVPTPNAGGGGGGPWKYVEPEDDRRSCDELFVEYLIAHDFDVTAALIALQQSDERCKGWNDPF